MARQETLSIRVAGSNPLHHLWNNHGVWWIHYTILINGVRQRRMRYSLRTRDLTEAKEKRDRIFDSLGAGDEGKRAG